MTYERTIQVVMLMLVILIGGAYPHTHSLNLVNPKTGAMMAYFP